MAIYVAAIDGMLSYDAGDASRMETQFITQEGVVGVTGDDLLTEAQTVPDMTVKVNPGSCYVERDANVDNDNTLKFWNVTVTTATNVEITTADPSNPRIDIICVKIDTGVTPDTNAANVASLVAVAGTPSGSPSAPSVPNNHLKIAEVSVGTGVTVINSGDITDNRQFIGLQLPCGHGYNLKDTGASLDAQLYEDVDGNVIIRSRKSGGAVRINPIDEEVQFKGKEGDSYASIGAGGGSANFWNDMPTPTRVSDTQFTIADVGNANHYDTLFQKGVILKWDESGTINVGMIVSSSYSANVVTINIVGDSLSVGFTLLKYCIQIAQVKEWIIPGTLAVETNVGRYHYAECDLVKLSVDAIVITAGTTNATVFDVNDDGTTIITTKPSIASGGGEDLDNVCDAPTTVIVKGSKLTVDIDSISTTAPIEAYIKLFCFPSGWLYRS
jgi:hypothetical protein